MQVVGQPLICHEGGNRVLLRDLATLVCHSIHARGRVAVDVGADEPVGDQPRQRVPEALQQVLDVRLPIPLMSLLMLDKKVGDVQVAHP